MSERSQALQSFLDAFRDAISARAKAGSPEAAASRRIFAALEQPGPRGPQMPARLPVCRFLAPAIASAHRGPAAAARLAGTVETLDPMIAWAKRPGADAEGPLFAEGHANGFLVGPGALEDRADVWVGLSLMAPGIRYPDHRHPPEEIYVALSPGDWRQGDDPWFEPGVGGILYNTPHIVHAMRSGDAPLLAAWCLWVAH